MRPERGDLAAFRCRLEEVLPLDADDPLRRAVEREVESAGAAATAMAAELRQEDRALRDALQRVQVPVGLAARLLEVPGRRRPTHRRVLSPLRLAGCILLALAVALGGSWWLHARGVASRVRQFAELAVANHLHDTHVTVATSDPGELSRRLSGELPFRVELHAPAGRPLVLEGGRKCALGTLPVAYSRWLGTDGAPWAVFQFVAADHGLPADLDPVEVEVDCLPGGAQECAARVWAEDGRGYVLVAPSPGGGARERR